MPQRPVQILLPSGVILSSAQCTSVTQTQTYNYSYVEDGRLVGVTLQIESKELSVPSGVPLSPHAQASSVGHSQLPPHNGGFNSTSIYSTPSSSMSSTSAHSHPSRAFCPNPVHSRPGNSRLLFGDTIHHVNHVNHGIFKNTQRPASGSTGNHIRMGHPVRPHAANPPYVMPHPGATGHMDQIRVQGVQPRDTLNYGTHTSHRTQPPNQRLDMLLEEASCSTMGQAVSHELAHGVSTTRVLGESKVDEVGDDDRGEDGLGAESNTSPEGSQPTWSDLEEMAGVSATPPQYHGPGSMR